MDPQQSIVLQQIESFKDAYLSKDYKTCHQLLGELQEIVAQNSNRDGNGKDHQGTDNEEHEHRLDMKSTDTNLLDEENNQDEKDAKAEEFRQIPYDGKYIESTNLFVLESEEQDRNFRETNNDNEENEEDEEEEENKEDEEIEE